jgi:hypothetical protein
MAADRRTTVYENKIYSRQRRNIANHYASPVHPGRDNGIAAAHAARNNQSRRRYGAHAALSLVSLLSLAVALEAVEAVDEDEAESVQVRGGQRGSHV